MAKSVAINDDDILQFYRPDISQDYPIRNYYNDNNGNHDNHDNDDDDDDFAIHSDSSVVCKESDRQDSNNEKHLKPAPSAAWKQPEVIRFHDPTASMRNQHSVGGKVDRGRLKGFLSADITKIHTATNGKSSASSRVSTAEADLDTELQRLLQTGRLAKDIEQFNASQLMGQDRRRSIAQQLTTLGLPESKGQSSGNRPKLARVPPVIAKGMIEKAKKRAEKVFTERQATGDDLVVSTATDRRHLIRAGGKRSVVGSVKRGDLILSSAQHPLRSSREGRVQRERDDAKRVRWDERGIRPAVGRFRAGCLHLSKQEVRSIERAGTNTSGSSASGSYSGGSYSGGGANNNRQKNRSTSRKSKSSGGKQKNHRKARR